MFSHHQEPAYEAHDGSCRAIASPAPARPTTAEMLPIPPVELKIRMIITMSQEAKLVPVCEVEALLLSQTSGESFWRNGQSPIPPGSYPAMNLAVQAAGLESARDCSPLLRSNLPAFLYLRSIAKPVAGRSYSACRLWPCAGYIKCSVSFYHRLLRADVLIPRHCLAASAIRLPAWIVSESLR